MVYQAQGASIVTTNSVTYGSISSYNNAGLYEFAFVKDVNGNTVNLASALTNSYTAAGMTQLVKVPQYTSLVLNLGSTVTPRSWKDTVVSSIRYRMGGIVAIHTGSLTNNGSITSAGLGFRGGQLDAINGSSFSSNSNVYTSTNTAAAGERGEGIAGYQAEYDGMGGRYGRGAAANGGGGGDGWNAGGGGGANGDNGSIWTGQGVMMVNGTSPLSAWALDPGYIANGNSLTTSSGGGRGGYSVAFSSQNPTITAPGNTAWSGDNRREVGGIGGRPLTNINASGRIYFGGGGGAGDENNSNGGAGGNGGGIVYLIATSGIYGGGIISVKGNDGFNTTGSGQDAPGGAGAGGSIIIKSPSVSTSQTIIANGGFGGNQNVSSGEVEGPGGGGGGGYVAMAVSSPTPVVFGGGAGQTNSPLMPGFTYEGATGGANGQSASITNTIIAFNVNSILTPASNSPLCPGNTMNLSTNTLNGATYSWIGPNSFTTNVQNPSVLNITTPSSGVYTVTSNLGTTCGAFSNTVNVVVNACAGIEEVNKFNDSFIVFPNPSSGIFYLKTPLGSEVKVYNSLGTLLLVDEIKTNDEFNINLASKPDGIYFITVKVGNKLLTKKVIKE
jgi:hypothetical protein